MKLTISYNSEDCWRCELLDDKALWLGLGESPIEAFNDYLRLVILLDKDGQDHFDYEWCKSKGLIK